MNVCSTLAEGSQWAQRRPSAQAIAARCSLIQHGLLLHHLCILRSEAVCSSLAMHLNVHSLRYLVLEARCYGLRHQTAFGLCGLMQMILAAVTMRPVSRLVLLCIQSVAC